MQIFKKGPDESTRQWLKRLAFERLTQVAVGLALLAISSGAYQVATDPGHEDSGGDTPAVTQKARDFRFNTSKIKDVLSAYGAEATHRLAPRNQMGLTASTSVSTIELRRRANNATRLLKIYKPMRPKVAAVLSDLEGKGWRPFIDVGVYRTPAEQMKKFRQGVSKVTWSFHNATNKDGTPGSLAADIVDTHWGWSNKCPTRYWLQIAASAKAHGLETGAYFGLSSPQKAAFYKAVDSKNWNAKVPLGWDASHNQPHNLNMKKARAGERPKWS